MAQLLKETLVGRHKDPTLNFLWIPFPKAAELTQPTQAFFKKIELGMPGESPEESLETEVVPKKQLLRHRNRMSTDDVD